MADLVWLTHSVGGFKFFMTPHLVVEPSHGGGSTLIFTGTGIKINVRESPEVVAHYMLTAGPVGGHPPTNERIKHDQDS